MDKPFEFPLGGEVSISDPLARKVLFHVYKGTDFWTRAPVSEADFVIDHVWPRAKGGPDSFYNYVPTTKSVNSSKSDKLDLVAATAVLSIIRIAYAPKCVKIYQKIKSIKERKKGLNPETCAPYTIWIIRNKEHIKALYKKHKYYAFYLLEDIMYDKGMRTLSGAKISRALIIDTVDDYNVMDRTDGRHFHDYGPGIDGGEGQNVSSL